ncbi:MAG: DUF1592 domain-containing protein [Myxococcota bacterium]
MIIALFALAACIQAPEVPGETGPVSFAPSPLRRLTQAEYRSSVADVLGVDASGLNLPADDVVGAFVANVRSPVSPLAAEQYAAAAEVLGAWVEREAADLVDCELTDDACVDGFIDDFGRRVWRHPLSPDDRAALRALFDVAETPARGLGLVVEGALQSPDFLYLIEGGRTEGDDRVVLDGYAVAARLSYFLWGTTPDDGLLAAAADGTLDTVEGVDVEARRLLASSRALRRIQTFYRQWLDVDELPRVTKDRERFPAWDDAMVAAMQAEVDQYVAHVYTEGPGTLEALLTTPVAFPSGPLWSVYGLSPSESLPVGVSPDERAGILTLPGVQAAHAHPATTSPIHRGLFVFERVFCRELGAPPDDVDLTPIIVEPGETATKREQFVAHQTEPACMGCHQAIDPLGFLFEHYGTLGSYRTFAPEEGQPVDAADEVKLVSALDGPYDDAVAFVRAAATDDEVRRCMVTQWARFALGRDDEDADESTLDALEARFVATGGDLRGLLVAIVTSEAFRSRALPLEEP